MSEYDEEVERLGDRLMSELMSFDRANGAGRRRGSRSVGVTFYGARDQLPAHVFRIADRYDMSVLHKTTEIGGRGVETRIEVVDDERLHSNDVHAARYDKDWSIIFDRSADDLSIKALEDEVEEVDQ